MIEIVKMINPFTKEKEVSHVEFIAGGVINDYIADKDVEIILNGNFIEFPNLTFPSDGDQIIVMPHVGSGGVRKFLGIAATLMLMDFTGSVAKGATGLFGVSHATLSTYLAAGAVMGVGGRIINSMFPANTSGTLSSGQSSSPTYGWETPKPITGEGGIIGVTYGECIPAPQVLECHIETINDKQYLNLLLCGGMGPVDEITDIRINGTPIENFQEATVEIRLGTNDQEVIPNFGDTYITQDL